MKAALLILAAVALGGCVIVVRPQVPPAQALENPCASIDCNRPDTSRIA